MNKQTIELTIPEGYEVAEGEQPREVELGDFYLGEDGFAIKAEIACPVAIILRKKAPKYWRGELFNGDNYKVCDVVEIQALKDALPLIPPCELDSEERATYEALKALVEGKEMSVINFGEKQLRTYLVLSRTNYGETVTVINAKGEDDMKEIARDCDTVWDGYTFIEVDTSIRGQLGCYGGE